MRRKVNLLVLLYIFWIAAGSSALAAEMDMQVTMDADTGLVHGIISLSEPEENKIITVEVLDPEKTIIILRSFIRMQMGPRSSPIIIKADWASIRLRHMQMHGRLAKQYFVSLRERKPCRKFVMRLRQNLPKQSLPAVYWKPF